jgi:hypothetical protein
VNNRNKTNYIRMKTIKAKPINNGYINLVLYSMAIIFLLCSIFFNLPQLLLIQVVLFLVYDILFVSERNSFEGRTVKETVESIRAACTYLSYVFILMSIFAGVILDSGNNTQKCIESFKSDIYLMSYSLISLIGSIVAMLFIPIQYKTKGVEGPSNALKNCFFFVLFMEKTVLLLFTYVVIQLVWTSLSAI